MSKKKQAGKLTQHKRPAGKRLGVKEGNGKIVTPGMILVRQRGTKINLGEGVKLGRDHTIFATKKGEVKFGTKHGKTYVSVI